MNLLLDYADYRVVIFDKELFDHQMNEDNKTTLIVEVNLSYLTVLHERQNDYLLVSNIIIIKSSINVETEHNLRA